MAFQSNINGPAVVAVLLSAMLLLVVGVGAPTGGGGVLASQGPVGGARRIEHYHSSTRIGQRVRHKNLGPAPPARQPDALQRGLRFSTNALTPSRPSSASMQRVIS